MGGNEVRDFNGFITQDGEMISIQDTERASAIFLKTADVDSAVGCLWQLAIDCIEAGYFIPACKYIEKILPLVDAPADKAECFLKMGQSLEQVKDYGRLERHTRGRSDLPREQNATRATSSTRSCWIAESVPGRCAGGGAVLRVAIRMELKRHNCPQKPGQSCCRRSTGSAKPRRVLIRANEFAPRGSAP